MPASAVIEVDGVSKRYRLGDRTPLSEGVHRAWAGLMQRFGRAAPSASDSAELWALRDVSFSVKRGEVLGLLGRNGAGKSTLLKLLSRITPPTDGRIAITGRVASLLEVGTGFHPELTGRENIFLNGSVLGMRRAEILARFDEIVDFAGVARFLDTPVKRYSSGMYVRLAFAVAAHLEAEILMIDEVLAVGDVAFQQKCLGKMQNIAESGRTVIYVSHNMGSISHFCERALRIERGQIVDSGDAATVVGRYISESYVARRDREFPAQPGKRAQIRRIALRGVPEGRGGVLDRANPFELSIVMDVNEPLQGAEIVLLLETADGTPICQIREHDGDVAAVSARRNPGTYEASVKFPGGLLNSGTLAVRALIEQAGGWEVLDHREGLVFDLQDLSGLAARQSLGKTRPGCLLMKLPWSTTARVEVENDLSRPLPTIRALNGPRQAAPAER